MKTEGYFELTAAADHRIRHPMSDLKLLEADLNEIEARAASDTLRPVHVPQSTATLDHDGIWDRVNGRVPKAEAPKASTTSLDVDAIWRKYNQGGPNPDPLLVK